MLGVWYISVNFAAEKSLIPPKWCEKTLEKEVLGYLAHQKHPPRRTLQWPYAQGPTVIQGG